MKTLEILAGITFDDFFKREMNQEATLVDQKKNIDGSMSYLVDFIPSSHPSDAKGLMVVVVEENEVLDINKDYVKSLFGIGSVLNK